MTSFIATSLSLLGHLPETVTAVLATTRPLTNCSIVPVILSNDDIWNALCAEPDATTKQRAYLKLFSTFSDTMQFTEKLRFEECLEPPFANQVLQDLIDTKRYFKSGVKHIDFVSRDSVKIAAAAPLTNLRTIDLNRCTKLKDAEFKLLCDKFPLLERLEMNFYDEMFGEDRFDITEDGIKEIGHLSNLKELDLINMNDEARSVMSVLKSLKKLERLTLEYCGEFTNENFEIEEEDADHVLFALRELKIVCRGDNGITDATINFLERHAPNLTSLNCRRIGASGLDAICSKHPNLSTLILEQAEDFSEDHTEAIATNFTKLQTLRLTGIGSSTAPLRVLFLIMVHLQSPVLETLSLESSYNLDDDDDDEDYYAEMCIENDSSLPRTAKHLRLSHFKNLVGQTDLTLALNSLSLLSLDLSYCTGLTSQGLKQALIENNNNSTKRTLEVLILIECTGLENLCFLKGLTNLKELYLAKTKLDFSSMREQKEIGFNLLPSSTLESLDLSETAIEDEDLAQFPVEALVKNQKLKRLDLSDCTNLNEESFYGVVSKLTSLQFLILRGFYAFDTPARKSSNDLLARAFLFLVEKLPNLSEFGVERTLFSYIHIYPVELGSEIIYRRHINFTFS